MKTTFPIKEDISFAYGRIVKFVHKTPVLTSRLINAMAGAQLYFKCENFQCGGSFKMRGACNAVFSLTPEERAKGVVTHSSGNFAQALALAAQAANTHAYIVMPENTTAVKKAAVHDYGGTIIISGNSPAEREAKAAEVQKETGATFIHPSNHREVIIGNATATQEFLEEIPDLDFIIAPVGGGGLIAGTALAVQHFAHESHTLVIGAEPTGADDAYRSLRDGVIYPSEHPQTICDGLRTNLGDVNFPIIRDLVNEIILVDDADTVHAMRLLIERMKIVVEPSAAITLAAVLNNRELFTERSVGLILSGGNVDVTRLAEFFAHS
jgi:threonine dehydratase